MNIIKNIKNIKDKKTSHKPNRREPFKSSNVVIQGVLTNTKRIWLQFQFIFLS